MKKAIWIGLLAAVVGVTIAFAPTEEEAAWANATRLDGAVQTPSRR